jgi:hypothetical protein
MMFIVVSFKKGVFLFIKRKIFSPSIVGQNALIECNDLSAFSFIVIVVLLEKSILI